jgi:hypothetical protein
LVRPAEEVIDVTKTYLMVIDKPEQGLAYHLIDGILYRQDINGMMMKCISKEEGIRLLQNIHSGVCESYSSWRSIIGKAFRHGFYWPITKDDAMKVVTKCKDYQFF